MFLALDWLALTLFCRYVRFDTFLDEHLNYVFLGFIIMQVSVDVSENSDAPPLKMETVYFTVL